MTQIVITIRDEYALMVSDSLYTYESSSRTQIYRKVFKHSDTILLSCIGYVAGVQMIAQVCYDQRYARYSKNQIINYLQTEWNSYCRDPNMQPYLIGFSRPQSFLLLTDDGNAFHITELAACGIEELTTREYNEVSTEVFGPFRNRNANNWATPEWITRPIKDRMDQLPNREIEEDINCVESPCIRIMEDSIRQNVGLGGPPTGWMLRRGQTAVPIGDETVRGLSLNTVEELSDILSQIR